MQVEEAVMHTRMDMAYYSTLVVVRMRTVYVTVAGVALAMMRLQVDRGGSCTWPG